MKSFSKPQSGSKSLSKDKGQSPAITAQHALEMFRRGLPIGAARSCLDRLSNRLTKITTEAHKLVTP
jgi:hypothetical protein